MSSTEKSLSSAYKHVYPIIDLMVEAAVRDVEDDDQKITCRKGCGHCCHLLVEVFWEEARELAKWILDQPEDLRQDWLQEVQANATSFQDMCKRRKAWHKYSVPFDGEKTEFSDSLCDAYFANQARPCSFLKHDICQAYVARPSTCRLHMVTSDPDLCRVEAEDDEDYNVPDRVEELGDDVGAINSAVALDGRRGQMGVMICAVLAEEFSEVSISQIN